MNNKSVSRKIKAIVAIGSAAIIVCISAALLQVWEERERDRNYKHNMDMELFRFAGLLKGWESNSSKMIAPTVSETIADMQANPEYREMLWRQCPTIVTGRDAWGRALIYRRDTEAKRVMVRSTGPNGHDDNGSSDDIQIEIPLSGLDN